MARLLIVEDDDADRLILKSILEGTDHEVYFASDGEQALEIYVGSAIDVVVTDLHMPGIHGLELIMTLRARDPEAKIIAVSATGPAQLAMAEELGADVVLSKPVDPHDLLEAVAKVKVP